MINFSQTRIDGLSVHGVGNRLNDGVLKLSAHPLELGGGLLQSLLCRWFFSPFRDPSRYTFGEDEQGQSLLAMANYVFANNGSLHENSALLAERLFNITEHPTAQWTAQPSVDTFPWDTAPRYLLRDRDSIYGSLFQDRVDHMGIEEVKIAPRSPWQNPYCERVIGSIRRDILDHVIVLKDLYLMRLLRTYLGYYHRFRTHLSLDMACPMPRPIQPPVMGRVQRVPEVGGLHHHYERMAV